MAETEMYEDEESRKRESDAMLRKNVRSSIVLALDKFDDAGAMADAMMAHEIPHVMVTF